MKQRKDYKQNKLKEKQEQWKIGAVINQYFMDIGYKVTKQEITEDKQLQSKGIDRIVYLTDEQEQYYVYVDDKAQRSTALFNTWKAKYNYLFMPYFRQYSNGKEAHDWVTSNKKETDIVVMTTADNLAILWDCQKLKETFHNNYDYLAYTYGYDHRKQEYYSLYNKLEPTDTMPGYEYKVYLIKPTLWDILKEPLLKQCILAIYDIKKIEKVGESRK